MDMAKNRPQSCSPRCQHCACRDRRGIHLSLAWSVKLLTVAGSTRSVMLDPVSAEAATLSDLFFMKHGLEHYDVPDEFADFQTIGCRVFDDDESQRIAQIWVGEKHMQFFLFPAERDTKTGAVLQ